MKIQIRKAFRMNRLDTREVPDGFDLFLDGEWHDRFRTKKDAKKEAEDILRRAVQPAPATSASFLQAERDRMEAAERFGDFSREW